MPGISKTLRKLCQRLFENVRCVSLANCPTHFLQKHQVCRPNHELDYKSDPEVKGLRLVFLLLFEELLLHLSDSITL